MECIKQYLFVSALFIISAINKGNDSVNLVKYTNEFKFTDGIYLDFIQVKKNAPVEKSRILTTTDYNDSKFFESVLKGKTFFFFDNFGKKFDVPVKSIWGYADNGILYIRIEESYFRVTVVGAICHFVAYVTTIDPYPGSYYSPYDRYSYSNSYRYGSQKTDLKQYLIDFKSGKRLEYTVNNVEILLMNDTELYNEFAALRKKKKKQLLFSYIRKYNERNPIYFPVNNIIP